MSKVTNRASNQKEDTTNGDGKDTAVSSGSWFGKQDDSKITEAADEDQEVEGALKKAHSHHKRHRDAKDSAIIKKRLHESRRVIFILGILLGLVATVLVSTWTHPDLKDEFDKLVNFEGVNDMFGEWKDMLPTGLQSLISDIDMRKENQLHNSAESFSVGKRMVVDLGLSDEHNVVMVPGVISTGIESWGTSSTGDCPSINHFRKRLWGSFYMLKTMFLDKTCWLKHVMLDPETGLDPPNIKLRAAQGFEAADFFVAGYWIWNKVLENLAVLGYGPNNMISAPYDWRLAYLDLERRDGYFSKLKKQIEITNELNKKKSILVGHSMGSQIIFYFMKWVEAEGELYGNGGPTWCNDNLEAFINISGSSLGTPKAIPALISGEMRDTVQLNALAVYGLEKFFSRKERVEMLRTFGGVPAMIPKGGDLIWGNHTHAPDDPTNTLETNSSDATIIGDKSKSFGTFINYNDGNETIDYTLNESIDQLLEISPDWFSNRVKEQYSFGIEQDVEELKKNNHLHSKWSNPLEAMLPNAPDMKIFCFYGVGKPTERAYTYTKAAPHTNLTMTIDLDLPDPVFLGDGDGTVSLMTHSICHEWQKGSKSRFNPGNISVTITEIQDDPDRFDIRGGARTADHVDILGSAELNEMVLKVASGHGDEVQNRYISNLREIVQELHI